MVVDLGCPSGRIFALLVLAQVANLRYRRPPALFACETGGSREWATQSLARPFPSLQPVVVHRLSWRKGSAGHLRLL